MIFANKKGFCRSERCREPAGSCSRRWWRRQPGCLTSTTDPTFSGDARNVEEFVFKYLLLHRRITHSFKEGEEFRKDEDIHKWGANLRSIGDIFNLRSLASAQINLDMLRRQASIGELYNPRSHSWADFSPFMEFPTWFAGWPCLMRRRSLQLETEEKRGGGSKTLGKINLCWGLQCSIYCLRWGPCIQALYFQSWKLSECE